MTPALSALERLERWLPDDARHDADLALIRAALTEGAEAVALLTEWGHARAAVARASNAAHDVAGRHGTAEALAIAEGIEVVCEEQVHALADRLTTTRPSAEGAK